MSEVPTGQTPEASAVPRPAPPTPSSLADRSGGAPETPPTVASGPAGSGVPSTPGGGASSGATGAEASDDRSSNGSPSNGPSDGSASNGNSTNGQSSTGQGAGTGNRRRRGSRGGRGRSRTGSGADGGPVHDDGETTGDAGPGESRPTAVPSLAPVTTSGGVVERPKIGDTRPSIGDTRPAPPGAGAATPTPAAPTRSGGGRNRQRSRSGGGGGGDRSGPKPLPVEAEGGRTVGAVPRAAAPAGKGEGRRGGRERRGKAVGRYQICVHVRPDMTQIALLEGRTLVEHYISRASDDATQIDGNIYRGRVQNVLPGMEAAFIDIGTPKNAVLYHGDVRYDVDDIESPKGSGQPRIEQLLKPGQTILCQVTKNPIGAKGARLTQEVSLPGRFVVLVPNSTAYGISKRLDDGERKRLRKIVDAVRPDGHGLIVRTAAAGASAEELEHDIGRLVDQWDAIAAASLKGQGAALLYREPAIAVRVIREELNREYRAVVIDDRALFEQVRDYVGAVNPELADRVEYYDPEAEQLPVFERFHVHEQLHKALDRKVYLPSGGSLVIDRTEALTVIDVNTGKNVGTTNLEETVYRNNLEAADEVARQLRLRDIGGIIVIDFIDMEIRENRDKVGAALRSALARDKTRTQVFDISELGLVEMTRKRVSEGLIESMSTTCEICEGRGIVFDDPEL